MKKFLLIMVLIFSAGLVSSTLWAKGQQYVPWYQHVKSVQAGCVDLARYACNDRETQVGHRHTKQ